MQTAILAVDQGTTNSKAVLVSTAGEVLARGSSPVGIDHPQPGWVEQSPLRIWQSVLEAIGACLESAPGVEVIGIAISNQRESVTAWDAKTGEPLGPVVSWQCRRTAPDCMRLNQAGHAERFRRSPACDRSDVSRAENEVAHRSHSCGAYDPAGNDRFVAHPLFYGWFGSCLRCRQCGAQPALRLATAVLERRALRALWCRKILPSGGAQQQ